MKRAALYVRVSTEEQRKHGLSVDSQIQALEDYCIKNNYIIVDTYNDAGISARKSYKKRPALLHMIEDCKGKKIDIILFTRLDRFFRSVPDYYACIEQMGGIPWRAIWEDYETETSAGVFKVNIMLSIAQAEADRTSERIKSINEYKRARGEYVGGISPTGYKKQGKDLVIDEEKREAVQKMFDTYLETWSTYEALRVYRGMGYSMTANGIGRILKNPTYYGDAYGYKCPAYITKDQYDSIQEHRKKYVRRTKENRVYLFSGLLKCGRCGMNLTAAFSTDVVPFRARYRCHRMHRTSDCPGLNIGESSLEKTLLKILDEQIELAIKEANYTNSTGNIKAMRKKEKKLKEQLNRIGERYELGDISKEVFFEKRNAIFAELNSINYKEVKIPEKLPKGWQDIYLSLDRQGRKAFWNRTVKSITITNETKTAPKVVFL